MEGAAVHLQQHAFLGPAVPAAAVSWRTAPLLGLVARLAAEALDRGAANSDALMQQEQLAQVAVVAAGVGTGAQFQHSLAQLVAESVLRGAAPVAVHEGGSPVCPVAGFQAPDMTHRDA